MTERAFVRSLQRIGLTDVTVHTRQPFGVDDCARYPLFPPDLIATMRRTIAVDRQAEVATCVTVSAMKPLQDEPTDDLIASSDPGNTTVGNAVLMGMSEQPLIFDAGDLHCGTGLPGQLRRWWDGMPAATRTTVVLRDPSAKADVPSLVRLLGHTVEEQSEAGGALRLTVRTKGV